MAFSRGPKRTFLPLRGLSKEWAFHCKGGSAREKTSLDFLEFSPYHTFLLHLFRSRVCGGRAAAPAHDTHTHARDATARGVYIQGLQQGPFTSARRALYIH
eukprot:scaffold90215_cov33-Phaeocystis_antarctica.AAC.1